MIVAELALFLIVGIVIALGLALSAPIWTRVLAGVGKTVNHQIHSAAETLGKVESVGDEKKDSQVK